jgi:hypothetical protein
MFMTAHHHSIYCDLIHNEDATNQNHKSKQGMAVHFQAEMERNVTFRHISENVPRNGRGGGVPGTFYSTDNGNSFPRVKVAVA